MNSSRLPESQSYSQISMLNKNPMLAVARNHGSTSSSEERTGGPVRPNLGHMANSEVSLKHSLRQRYNNIGGTSGNMSTAMHISETAQNQYKLGHVRPSVHSHNVDMGFSKNQ